MIVVFQTLQSLQLDLMVVATTALVDAAVEGITNIHLRLPLLHLKSYLQKTVDRLALVLKMRDHVKHNVIVIFVVYGMVHLVMTLKLRHPNLHLLQKLAAAR